MSARQRLVVVALIALISAATICVALKFVIGGFHWDGEPATIGEKIVVSLLAGGQLAVVEWLRRSSRRS